MDSRYAQKHQECALLHAAGHAVTLDTAYFPDGRIETVKIHHYLTCEHCIKDRLSKPTRESK